MFPLPVTTLQLYSDSERVLHTQLAGRWQIREVWPILIGAVSEFLLTIRPTNSLCEDAVGFIGNKRFLGIDR